jgi:hypothetical protein
MVDVGDAEDNQPEVVGGRTRQVWGITRTHTNGGVPSPAQLDISGRSFRAMYSDTSSRRSETARPPPTPRSIAEAREGICHARTRGQFTLVTPPLGNIAVDHLDESRLIEFT